jgi:hypothetical protein
MIVSVIQSSLHSAKTFRRLSNCKEDKNFNTYIYQKLILKTVFE